jgi:hypothetical protein
LAILDAVCVVHKRSAPNKPNSVYKAGAPYGTTREEELVRAGVGYSANSTAALGEEAHVARCARRL